MQALSILPSKTDFWIVRQLELEVGSSCISLTRRMRRKRWDLSDPVCHSTRSSLLLFSSNSRLIRSGTCFGSPKFDMECGFFSKYSRLGVYVFCEPKKGSFGASFALGWALEEQALGIEIMKKDSNSLDQLSGKVQSEDIDCIDMDEVKNRALPRTENENDADEDDNQKEEQIGKEKSARVDVRALAWSLRFAKTSDDVEEVLKDKPELPLQVYSSMIRGLGKDKRLESAMALVEWLKRKRKDTNGLLGPNLFIYNSLLGAMKQSENFDEGREVEALKLFEEIENKGLSPSPASYSTALLAYRRLEDGFEALKFYVELREKYRKGDIGKDADEDWEKEFAKLENFTVRICYQVMRCWLVKDENLSTNVLKLLTEMDKAGIQTGRTEHERLVWACTREEHYTVVKELYNRIREMDSGISLSVCNHVIWLMGKAKKWWAALEVKDPRLSPMGHCLVLLKKGNCTDEALRVWEHMIRVGVEPNVYAYTIMASIYAAQGKFNIVDSIIRDMVSSGVEPTVVTFNAIISVCARNNMESAAYEWFHRMKAQNISPNEVTYEMLIEALAKDGKPRLAYELYLRANNECLNLSTEAYDAVMQSSQVHGATIDISALGPRPPEKKKKVQTRKTLSEPCNLADVSSRSKPFDRKEIYTSQTE
ncbi:hypothetical protein F0562_004865 [Nyssa sinensis]|uniref:Uncharacterized protein n=1 Tax=Nyssa sinensis TaxID=561372 RepID=A0A5J5AKH1_9ASTE|nr:hypothetical protein F0562_004865 [Nyssa sinensis]